MSDTLRFFRSWLADPLRVASIIPSGNRLADLMTSGIDPAQGPVVELGPGTGVFTRALIRQGFKPGDLTLVELGRDFAALLAERHPEAVIVVADAAHLNRLPPAAARRHAAAVSGLPLLSMPPAKVMRILAGTFRLLDTNASFYQFTYGWRCPVPAEVLRRLELHAVKIGTAVANIPPASVYRISMAGSRAAPRHSDVRHAA
ncbi:class I SAM-dependent methyltransferase [Neoaquamicrobium sediminum]|uniref:SAM-dependent methyltransferase n=1 Tax=Neoaquamicrobium sediminum TaxID=1849104 RepID=A0ABV3WYX9_9HYPH